MIATLSTNDTRKIASMKISIITAVYNRAGTLNSSIDSVQSQCYANTEHVLVDGASSDGSWKSMCFGFTCSNGLLIAFVLPDSHCLPVRLFLQCATYPG